MIKSRFSEQTKVLTSKGYIPIKDVNREVKIMGKDGKEHSVLYVGSQGLCDTYRVTFTNDVSILCDKVTTFGISLDSGQTKNVTVEEMQKILKKKCIKLSKIAEVDFSNEQREKEDIKWLEIRKEFNEFCEEIDYDSTKYVRSWLAEHTRGVPPTEEEIEKRKLYDERRDKYIKDLSNVIEFRPIHPYIMGLLLSDMVIKLKRPTQNMIDWYFEAPHIVGGFLVKYMKRLHHDVKQIVVERYTSNIYMTSEFWWALEHYLYIDKCAYIDNDVIQFTRVPLEYILSKITVRHILVRGLYDFNRVNQNSVENYKCISYNEIEKLYEEDYLTPESLQSDKRMLLETLGFIIKPDINHEDTNGWVARKDNWTIKEVKKLPKQREMYSIEVDTKDKFFLIEHCIPVKC